MKGFKGVAGLKNALYTLTPDNGKKQACEDVSHGENGVPLPCWKISKAEFIRVHAEICNFCLPDRWNIRHDCIDMYR